MSLPQKRVCHAMLAGKRVSVRPLGQVGTVLQASDTDVLVQLEEDGQMYRGPSSSIDIICHRSLSPDRAKNGASTSSPLTTHFRRVIEREPHASSQAKRSRTLEDYSLELASLHSQQRQRAGMEMRSSNKSSSSSSDIDAITSMQRLHNHGGTDISCKSSSASSHANDQPAC